jgi:hypothetical protein
MKTFTYVAAIALLTAGTAFAQSSNNASTINNSTPTPSATGPADSAGTGSMKSAQPILGGKQSGSMNMDKSGSMGNSSSMNQSSDMDQSSGKSSKHARHVASARSGGNDSKENQETMRLNRQQVAGMPGAMNSSGMGASGSGAGNPFNNGSPQQAQGGGANCTPDTPSCGTARQNPAINSSPQHRTYGDQQ